MRCDASSEQEPCVIHVLASAVLVDHERAQGVAAFSIVERSPPSRDARTRGASPIPLGNLRYCRMSEHLPGEDMEGTK